MIKKSKVKVSVVAPVYNEEEGILEFAKQLRIVLDNMNVGYEVIFVNDGSTDKSLEKIQSLVWKQVKIISFVSNSGQVSAVDAGYRASSGDYVVAIDTDLQNPVELIPLLVKKAEEENLDVVYCVNNNRANQSFIKRTTAKLYYKAIRFLSDVKSEDNASEYRLISKRVVDAIRILPPGKRMIRMLVASFNFPSGVMPYNHGERYAGKTKYNFKSLIALAINSILGFSTKPLKLSIYVGLLMTLVSFFGLIYAVAGFFRQDMVPGWASTMFVMFFLFGVMFFMQGIMGSYIGKILEHVNHRPDYIIDDKNSKL